MLTSPYLDLIRPELEGIYGEDILRDLNKTIELYNFYEGEDDDDKTFNRLDYTPTKRRTNIVKKLIKEQARFLFGKAPEFKLLSSDTKSAEELQNLLLSILKVNKYSEKIIKAARDCFIGKRVALKINFSENKEITFSFRNSMEFVYETADDNPHNLKKIIYFYGLNDKSNKKEQRIFKQKYELINGKCILNEGIYNGYGEIVEATYTDFDTQIDFIPSKVIINDGLSSELKGESDVEPLMELQKAYNMLASDDIDALKFNMFPQMVALDADPKSIKNMVIAPSALVDLQTDPISAVDGKQASLAKIESSFNYDARIENALNRIKNDMHEMLNIPNISPSELKGFITSGKSMKALYWQLVTRCEEKFCSWRPALEWLAESILKIAVANKTFTTPIPSDLKINVENIYPLMEDEFDEKSSDLQAINALAMSRKEYLIKWGKDVDADRALEEIAQIQLEKRMFEDSFSGSLDGVGDS